MDMFPSVSRWVNPTDKVVKLDLCMKANAEKGDGRMRVEILPVGATPSYEQRRQNMHELDRDGRVICARLPSDLDGAIHIIRDGVIVGGYAPQLRKLDSDQPTPTLAPELDPLDTAKKAELDNATLALAQKEAAERQLIISGAKVADISGQQQAVADAQKAAEQATTDAAAAKAEAEAIKAEALQMKADAEKMKKAALKEKADAEKATATANQAKADADAAMAAATAPSGAGGGDDNSGKGGAGKAGGK